MTESTELQNYAELVLDNVTKVSGANCFKISDKIELKKDGGGYDLKSFWLIYFKAALDRSMEKEGIERLKYLLHAKETSRCLQELETANINKKILVDDWILSIRREVMSLG